MTEGLVKALADLKESEVLETVKKRLAEGDEPVKILEESRTAMEIVGKRFATREYYIPDLVYSGEILRQITELVKPKLSTGAKKERENKIILGTVAGDIHDIGLNIVEFILDVNGFEVYNLGVDQSADNFVIKVKETGAKIVALSVFLTLSFESMKETVEAIQAAGLRDKVKIIIGGGQIDEQVNNFTGADAYGKDAITAVTLAEQWSGGK